jgi:chorismate synthase
MTRLELTTAGESHGPGLTAIVSGLPAGLPVGRAWLDAQLARRQGGHGRSPRQQVETDVVEVSAGLRHGRTLGSPVALHLRNRDHERSWSAAMSPWPTDDVEGTWRDRPIHVPRPGHADLGGIARGAFDDGLRSVLERASARETAARVAGGALAQELLAQLGIRVRGWVRATGAATTSIDTPAESSDSWSLLDTTRMRTLDEAADDAMVAQVDAARAERDTLGGVVEVVAWGLPPGIGGYTTNAERLDGRLARAAMSVHAMKSVNVGDGDDQAIERGSLAHDELFPVDDAARAAGAGQVGGDQGMGVTRRTNRAGGIEGGMANGAPIVLRVGMKPLPTLMRPLATVDLASGAEAVAHAERSDTCAISAAAVALECAVAFELAVVLREQFGGGSLVDVRDAFERYAQRVGYPLRTPLRLA